MGAGGSYEAEYALVDDINAGRWQLVADGIVTGTVDVTLELFIRRGEQELPIGSLQRRFERLPSGFNAQPVDLEFVTDAHNFVSGDKLVFRYSGQGGTPMAFIPNGEGGRAMGRIPNITLPP